jgi:hypothetical protein
VKLQIGTVAESVTVGASAAIDASQADVSSLVDRNAIHDLPINGRGYYDFALLTPGVARRTLRTARLPRDFGQLRQLYGREPILLTPTAGFLALNNDASPPDGTNARRLQLSLRFRF